MAPPRRPRRTWWRQEGARGRGFRGRDVADEAPADEAAEELAETEDAAPADEAAGDDGAGRRRAPSRGRRRGARRRGRCRGAGGRARGRRDLVTSLGAPRSGDPSGRGRGHRWHRRGEVSRARSVSRTRRGDGLEQQIVHHLLAAGRRRPRRDRRTARPGGCSARTVSPTVPQIVPFGCVFFFCAFGRRIAGADAGDRFDAGRRGGWRGGARIASDPVPAA